MQANSQDILSCWISFYGFILSPITMNWRMVAFLQTFTSALAGCHFAVFQIIDCRFNDSAVIEFPQKWMLEDHLQYKHWDWGIEGFLVKWPPYCFVFPPGFCKIIAIIHLESFQLGNNMISHTNMIKCCYIWEVALMNYNTKYKIVGLIVRWPITAHMLYRWIYGGQVSIEVVLDSYKNIFFCTITAAICFTIWLVSIEHCIICIPKLSNTVSQWPYSFLM